MDFKGINWAGNLYQKFEAMCLEMEEVMYQDTVKYLENQVHTVGSSVKKFYSEVMEDFLPPSCGDPVKVATADLQIDLYSHTEVTKNTKKPKQIVREDPKEAKTKELGDSEVMARTNAEHKSSFIELDGVIHSQTSDGNFCAKECSELYPGRRKTGGLYRRPTVGSKGSGNWDCTSQISGSSPPSWNTWRISSLHEKRSRSITAYERTHANESVKGSGNSDRTSEISGSSPPPRNTGGISLLHEIRSESINAYESTQANDGTHLTDKDVCTSDASRECPAPGTSVLRETFVHKQDDLSSIPTPDIFSEPIDSGTHDEICSKLESKIGSSTCASGGEDVILAGQGRLNNCDMDVVNNVVEPGLEIVERLALSKFEEACVLVEGDEVHAVSQKEGKHKSYKKKIREAFSSKIRSTRKQEYEKLAAQYSVEAPKPDTRTSSKPTSSEDLNQEKLQAHCLLDPEWELL